MKQIIIVLAMVLAVSFAFGQTIGSAPAVSGVTMQQTGGIVRVTYDLSYAANETYSHITLVISNDGGTTYKVSPKAAFLEGDIGAGVPAGEDKEIVWRIHEQYVAEGEQGLVGANFRARVIAKRDDNYDPDTYNPDDPALSVPAGMVFVQGTADVTFDPGGLGFFNPGEGGDDYDVSLSSFYISQFAVTQDEWKSVMGGLDHNPNWNVGQGPNHPAYYITWFDAIEYCNRRSLMEGLTPCYSYTVGETEHGTNPDDWPAGWNTSDANHTNVSCNWDADGYRLPTEMEREYASRGGVPAATAGTPTFNHTYAGTNEEDELANYAWYVDNAGWRLPEGSEHPDYGTHSVGTKLPNELGLYDMSGNVWNWVWDIWDWDYPTGSYNDPKGSPSGSLPVLRGGSWYFEATDCRVGERWAFYATIPCDCAGFRVSRTLN